MEKFNAEIESSQAEVTSKTEVLSIRDNDSYLKPIQTEAQKYDMINFKDDFKRYLALLLLGKRTPIQVKDDWNTMDLFEMETIENDNQPTRFRFYCHRGGEYEKYHGKRNGTMVNAKIAMHEVRKRLKDENWKSKYELETPLKAKIGNKQNDNEINYMGDLFNDTIYDIDQKMCQFIYYLHKQYVKEQAIKFT